LRDEAVPEPDVIRLGFISLVGQEKRNVRDRLRNSPKGDR
jgi:hypothetical protein